MFVSASKGIGPISFPKLPTNDWNYWGYAVPIMIGFLVGPWLDLQQWQRAIQMHREKVSIAAGYIIGSSLFFLLILFHGLTALWALNWGAAEFIRTGITGHNYGQEILLRMFSSTSSWTFSAYAVFVSVCVLTTLDSGYIALKWFFKRMRARVTTRSFLWFPHAFSRPRFRPSSWLVSSPFLPLFCDLSWNFHDLLRHIFCGLLDTRHIPLLHYQSCECDSAGEDVLYRESGCRHFLIRLFPEVACVSNYRVPSAFGICDLASSETLVR